MKRLYSIVVSLIILTSLNFGPTYSKSATGIRNRYLLNDIASDDKSSLNNTERGILGDGWADVVLGQPDFSQITPNEVVGNKLFNPGGVYVDRSIQPNRVYVYDAGNNRVLGLSHLGICFAGVSAGQACTSGSDCPGSTCQIDEGKSADIVLGQPTFNSSACNGDSGLQDYPNLPQASADSLCGMLVTGVSILESGSSVTMATDNAGNLYVPDVYNHRVLRYNDPFDSDAIADYVWGQSDFSGNLCNRGAIQPDNKSLCLAPPPFVGDIKSGVALDLDGNLWVADTQNNRVLRFPFDNLSGVPAEEADLVLGQPNFSSSAFGIDLNQLNRPDSVRMDQNGFIYVADGPTDTPGRVLFFEPPFSNGMTANGELGTDLKEPTGLEIDPDGGVWVNDSENNRLLHFVNGVLQNTVDSVPNRIWGGLGIDQDGNLMVTGWDPQQVIVYSKPAYTWESTFLMADDYGSFNQAGPRGFHEGLGIEIAAGQLIYGDGSRMLFWNNPWNLTNYQPADGVIGEPDFKSWHKWSPYYQRMRADDQGRLWVIYGSYGSFAEIHAYELPLRDGADPIIRITSPLPLQGGGEFNWKWTLILGGIDIQPGCDCLWLSDSDSHRVFRIKDVSTDQRVVDIILGQNDISSIHCNQGRDSDDGYIHPVYPTQDSLCHPGALAFDQDGNLFVADHNLEVAGNWRLMQFESGKIPDNPQSATFGIPATRVFGRNNDFTESNCVSEDPMCGPWEPTFDSQDRMAIGFNGYLGPRFIQIYQDPQNNPLPISSLNDFFSQPTSARFDQFDNLYVYDHTRHRILIYKNQKVQLFSVTGTIKDSHGAHLSGVQVETLGYASNDISDESGVFELNDLVVGTYTLFPRRTGCTFQPHSLIIDVQADITSVDFVATCAWLNHIPIVLKN